MIGKKLPLVAVCGKFQPFHTEHFDYVLQAFTVGDHVIIGITNPDPTYVRFEEADPQRSTLDANPFTYYERYLMVLESLRDKDIGPEKYDIVPFPINVPEFWFNYIPKEAVFLLTLYDDDKWLEVRKKKLEEKGIITKVLWSRPKKGISGSQVRNQIKQGLPWDILVPSGTARVIRRLHIEERLRSSI
jgi:cytidyltransferase-like protein